MFWLIALVAVEIIVLVPLVFLAFKWGAITVRDLLPLLGIALVAAVIAHIGTWALVYGISESLS